MRPTDHAPDPSITPAPLPLPLPMDIALRRLTVSANHGVLWFGIGAVGVLAGGRYRRAALRGVTSLAMASFVSNSVVKPLVGRRRPDAQRTSIARRVGKVPWTSSFPSGHSASAAAFATGAALEFPTAGLILGPLAGAVAYSRVHVGVHYRSDALVGMAIGAAMAIVGRRLWPVRPYSAAAMAPGSAPALPGGRGMSIVINAAAGTADGTREALSELLPGAEFVEWDPTTEELSDVVPKDVLAIGVAGGDGTVASVAGLAEELGLPLAVFPRGTLNHFAVALALEGDADTVSAIESGTSGQVDLATINGTPFLNTASIGGYPELVRRRDRLSHRMGKWPAAAYALYRTLRHHSPMDLEIDGKRMPIWVVFVGNGPYRPRGLAPAWRDDLHTGLLDVQYLRADVPLARTKAILFSFLGLVERSKVFGSLEVPDVTIASHDGPLPAAHDGEITDPVETIELAISNRLTVYHG
ncbi:undecaprenyl-diphosphatase [Nakamurella sp. UYEF19]|uniref:bifunctional phosphatase PAP2/diacylglycerol kinase family protein n=1 Tax=Nakamurella sp. UYEF19 TaxID=1756392 RepID=UPI003395EE5D